MPSGWRFLAYALDGADGHTLLTPDLPLSGVSFTRELSGPGDLSASITPEHPRLIREDGGPVVVDWQTMVVCELDGRIMGAYIVTDHETDGKELRITGTGLAGYLSGMPFTSDYRGIQVDPMEVVSEIWRDVRSRGGGGRIGLNVPKAHSPVRIGEEPRDVSFETSDGDSVEFEAGPYTLNWWSTDDLMKELNDLASETPFDWVVDSRWSGETVESNFIMRYPSITRRVQDMRFMVGENIVEMPGLVTDGDDYVSEVMVLGAGEGRDMIRGRAKRAWKRGDRLRRVKVITDKSIRSRARADARAEDELKRSLGAWDFSEVVVRNHPNAPLPQLMPGDEILITVPEAWNERLELWVRVLSIKWDIEKDRASLTVARTEKV